ncbi:MAG: hypothetical protein QOI63_1439, partial [Thermoplasmata archaeon]|nr:hypothetical protein [Thermoplasmata archaeon]
MPVGNLSAKEIEALEMASGEALAGKSLFNK